MFNPVRSRFSLAVGALLAMAAMPAAAGPTLEDTLALSMSKGLRDRMFWNLSVVSTKTKTKSEEPRDQFAGGVVSMAQMQAAQAWLKDSLPADPALYTEQDRINEVKATVYGDWRTGPFGFFTPYGIAALPNLNAALVNDYGFAQGEGYLGTPKGIKAKSGDPSETLALSVGYFLGDGHNWAVEALVLGAPLRATVYGAGVNEQGKPNGLSREALINTKMLPPLVKFGYYFGDKSWVLRPYAGVAAMYAIFFDTKTTDDFDFYQGGKTSVSIKNAAGIGPFVGLESNAENLGGWRIGFQVGKIKLKTEATLVTRDALVQTGSPVLSDYPTNVAAAISLGESVAALATSISGVNAFPDGLTTELMRDVAAYKKSIGQGDGSLGTFVRKQKTELSNTIFMLSVGRSF